MTCVAAFRLWLRGTDFQDVEPERREWILENLHLLDVDYLVCFCAPKECHGDVYGEFLHELTGR